MLRALVLQCYERGRFDATNMGVIINIITIIIVIIIIIIIIMIIIIFIIIMILEVGPNSSNVQTFILTFFQILTFSGFSTFFRNFRPPRIYSNVPLFRILTFFRILNVFPEFPTTPRSHKIDEKLEKINRRSMEKSMKINRKSMEIFRNSMKNDIKTMKISENQ